MKVTLEQIADYVRGLAAPEVARLIEQDPEALAQAKTMMAVVDASRHEAPEMWVLRAKALLVEQVQTIPLLFGRLVPRTSGPAMGYRSGSESNRIEKFQFEGASLDVSVREDIENQTLHISGVFEGALSANAQVGNESDWLGLTDDEGQFIVTLTGGSRTLRILNSDGSQMYQIEVPK